MIRTNNGGHVAMGSTLSITNGTPFEVRGYILEREAQDKERRKAYRKKPDGKRPGSKHDNFQELVCPAHLA